MHSLRKALLQSWRANRPLTFLGLSSLALVVACGLGLMFDHRTITGMPAWDKPAKFAVSVALYSFTLVWILGFVTGRWARLAHAVAWVTAAGLLIELAIIVFQAARGTTSHFNVSAPLDAGLYAVMGVVIAVVWGANFVAALLLVFQKLADPALAWSIRLGVALSLIGGAVGAAMVVPTPAQKLQSPPTLVGAHTVGAVDGGPGLPFLGWSTVHGDLRVPHFVGLHALQLLPLLFWLISRRAWAPQQRLALVWTAALSYLGLIALLFWQAERGQSVVAPDGQTLGAAGLLLVLTLLTLGLIARRRPSSVPGR